MTDKERIDRLERSMNWLYLAVFFALMGVILK